MKVVVRYGLDTETGEFFDPQDNSADVHAVIGKDGVVKVNGDQTGQVKPSVGSGERFCQSASMSR